MRDLTISTFPALLPVCLEFIASSVLRLLSKGMPPKKAAKGGGKSDKTKQAAKAKVHTACKGAEEALSSQQSQSQSS